MIEKEVRNKMQAREKAAGKRQIDLQKLMAPAGLVIIFIIFSIISRNFLTESNIMSILMSTTVSGVLAIGMTYCIIGGGMDLSVGTNMTLSMVMMALFMNINGMPILICVLLGVLCGALIGLINGVLIAKVKIPPFIQTLGMMYVCKGLALVVSGTRPIYLDESWFLEVTTGTLIGNVPNGALILLLVCIIAYVLLSRTIFGRYTYAIGSNEEATRLSGISVVKWKIAAYVMSGAMAGIAAMLTCSRLSSAQPSLGEGYEMEAIAACIIGGASPKGGEGSVQGTVIGAFLMTVLMNGLRIMSVPAEWQTVVEGAVIILAVYLDMKRKSN